MAALVCAPVSSAQPKPAERAAALQKLTDCRRLSDGAARLACYDEAAAGIDQAEAKGDIVVVDREQARKVRRQGFGFNLPSMAIFERGEKQEDVENAAGKIAAFRVDGAGKWILRLDDGATWAQVDANELHRTPKIGMPVRIRRAAMGSYLLSIDGQRAFRANRTE
ncbi:hypothetical protein [Phenylobacterium sp.]|uniref:hypothetical protein n=1 Tax=Phenylobacterium sp. TaxID=1871053 RepID=UPI003982FEE4